MVATHSPRPGKTVEGVVSGRIKPRRPPWPDGFEALVPGEHPRVLLRRSELPALRKKFASPFGQSLAARLAGEKTPSAVGLGLLYQLTGDAAYAERSRVAAQMELDGKISHGSVRGGFAGAPRALALSYDLCYDAWPADFRQTVEQRLVATARRYLAGRGMAGGINWHVCSNWAAKIQPTVALIGLALWGEKGEAPPRPDNEALLPFWLDECARRERLGGVNMEYQRFMEEGRYLVYLHYREAVGTGGYRGEIAHYGLKAAELPIEYASCHRRMFGWDVSPYADITYLLPRQIFGHHYPAQWTPFGEQGGKGAGKPVPLNLNGWAQIWADNFPMLYPVVPEPWQGAALWAWNRQLGITGPEGAAKARLRGTGRRQAGMVLPPLSPGR